MLPGVKIIELKRHIDERGSFTELMRKDWKDLLGEDEIVQVNLSISYPGIIRAWHKHERGQVDYFLVIKGALKICAFDEETEELNEIVSSEEKLQIVRIPGKYWHGTKTVSSYPSMLIYFTNRLYDYKNPDELRRPWNDPTIVPKIINGKKDDPRCNKPWDWLALPHK